MFCRYAEIKRFLFSLGYVSALKHTCANLSAPMLLLGALMILPVRWNVQRIEQP